MCPSSVSVCVPGWASRSKRFSRDHLTLAQLHICWRACRSLMYTAPLRIPSCARSHVQKNSVVDLSNDIITTYICPSWAGPLTKSCQVGQQQLVLGTVRAHFDTPEDDSCRCASPSEKNHPTKRHIYIVSVEISEIL